MAWFPGVAGAGGADAMTTETPTRTPRPTASTRPRFEQKWRERWEADELYVARDDDPRPKRYVLTMYPYPSGDLHIGHWYADDRPGHRGAHASHAAAYNVMFPMGFDGFGLPAENAAIDRGIHPAKWTYANIDTHADARCGLMGAMFDWSREVVTCDPDVLPLDSSGSSCSSTRPAWRTRRWAPVDWCPKDKVVLAREQVAGHGAALLALRHAGRSSATWSSGGSGSRTTPTSC